MSSNREIRVLSDPAAVAQAGTEEFLRISDVAIRDHGRFCVALSGGSTPKAMFQILARDNLRGTVPWSSIHLFWGDERHVAPDHQDSNFRMTSEALLTRVPIPEANVHRIRSENPDAGAAANEYARELTEFFGLRPGGLPRFDLVMLGMGPDGHCASLFPGTFAVRERLSLVVAPWVDKFTTYRITMSPPVLNHGREVMFLVGGADKADTLWHVLEGSREPDRYPSQTINPPNGKLLWLVDQAAAAKLKSGE